MQWGRFRYIRKGLLPLDTWSSWIRIVTKDSRDDCFIGVDQRICGRAVALKATGCLPIYMAQLIYPFICLSAS